MKFTVWDVSTRKELWKHYFGDTDALIFVVDSSDHERVAQAAQGFQVRCLSLHRCSRRAAASLCSAEGPFSHQAASFSATILRRRQCKSEIAEYERILVCS